MYNFMWNRYNNGTLTYDGWINFCHWNMWECVMKNPEVVTIMQRMKFN